MDDMNLDGQGGGSFCPHLLAIVELPRPTQITFYGITGGPKRYTVLLPEDLASWTIVDQLAFVKVAAIQNYGENDGRMMFLGRILGYAFFRDPEERPIRLSVTGDLDSSTEPFHLAGPVTLTVGGKKLNGYFSK